MISPAKVFSFFGQHGVDFYTGVPDSLLKHFCAYVTEHAPAKNHVIAANEGAAVGIASGYYLGSQRPALVYLQNSGLGNTVNPLLSLADPAVYGIPMIFLIGWRGEPRVKDEPQHVKQGQVMLPMLDAMQMPYRILSSSVEKAAADVEYAVNFSLENSRPFGLIVRKDTFEPYLLKETEETMSAMVREDAIRQLLDGFEKDSVVVSTTGMISRELFEVRKERNEPPGQDFLTVGSMGHAGSIAMGVASQRPERTVYCIDGDGSLLMHLGSLAIQGQFAPSNFKHIVLNNGCHDSVGGQPTVGFDIKFSEIASSCGYQVEPPVKDLVRLKRAVEKINKIEGPSFLEVSVAKGSRSNLGRPTSTPLENRDAFIEFLKDGHEQ